MLTVLLAGAAAFGGFMDGVVQDEQGFEGAVTVVETVEEGDFGYVTVNVPYRDVYDRLKMGQARLVLRRREVESGDLIPALCHVHYERSTDSAKGSCRNGWAVATAHYGDPKNGKYPLEAFVGDSYNLAKAMIQWVRRLPFIDRQRLHIEGGSAGGYMALAMSAEMFPVTSTTADVPVVNMAYNLNYIEANKPVSKYPIDLKDSPLPVLCAVTMLADWCRKTFDHPYDADTWYYLSPVAYLDRITSPTHIVCATGDMLVPHCQMTAKVPRPFDPATFPEGYVRDFDSLTLCDKARVRFDDLIPEEDLFVHLLPMPEEGLHQITLGNILKTEEEPPGPPGIDRPWDPEKQWNVVYLDEGPPLPHSGHARYKWSTGPDSFLAHYQDAKPSVDLLTAPKLERLLRRYTGDMNEKALVTDGTPVHRRNSDTLERLDVVQGLLDYADFGFKYRRQLRRLYKECPVQPFGGSLRVRELERERRALKEALARACARKEAA
jgi:hypothetical protein